MNALIVHVRERKRERESDRFALIQPLTSICCNTVISNIILIFNGCDCTNEDSKHTHNQPIVHPIIQANFPTNSFSICASIPLKHHGIYSVNCQSLSCKALKVKSNRACRMYTCMYTCMCTYMQFIDMCVSHFSFNRRSKLFACCLQ